MSVLPTVGLVYVEYWAPFGSVLYLGRSGGFVGLFFWGVCFESFGLKRIRENVRNTFIEFCWGGR